MTTAILNLAPNGSRKAPPIRLDKEIGGALYLDRWYYEPGPGRVLKKCNAVQITPETVILKVPTAHDTVLFDHIFVHLQEIGLLRGKVSRVMGAAIYMDLEIEENSRARLASHLLYMHRRDNFQVHDLRQFPRYRPKCATSRLSMAGRRPLDCSVGSVWPTGAEVVTRAKPAVRSYLALGQINGQVVQHTEVGFDMSFLQVQDPRTLEDLIFVDHPAEAESGEGLELRHSQMIA